MNPIQTREKASGRPGLSGPQSQGSPDSNGDSFQQRKAALLGLGLRVLAAGPILVLLCIWLAFALLSPYFFTHDNITNILVQSSSVALLALGALTVIMVGSLDLSLGATMGLCTIIGALLFRENPSLGWMVVPAMCATGILVGLVNSFLIVTLRIGNAFIVTLGMLYVVQSLSYVESGGTQIQGVPDYLISLASGHVLGIPGPFVFVLVAGGLLAFFLNRVAWGRWIVAIGGDADAAEKVGIPVKRVLFSVYVIASLFAAFAALVIAGLNDAGAVENGTSILLAIAAVVIGGASLKGGRGSVWATIVGALILSSITNGLTLLSVSPNWTPFAVGSVLIVAVGLDALRNNLEGRLRVRQAQLQGEARG